MGMPATLRPPPPRPASSVPEPIHEPEREVHTIEVPHQELAAPARPLHADENVQFTVYRPKAMQPARWYPLLAFAHLAERRADADDDEPDPIAEVQRQAEQALGADAGRYVDVTQDSRAAVPAEGELTIVPELPGVDVNPRSRAFLWTEPVHREEFRIRAGAALDGQTVRGKVTVWLGSLILAEIPLAIRVGSGVSSVEAHPAPARARAYRKIFASYSHRDAHIVDEVSRLARALGDEYIRDWVHLRSGQVWDDQLRTLIAEADIFQLFWSNNSMRSRFCRDEWEYALSLERPSFVRPTYWEEPMPTDAGAGLPPESLVRLHFQRIRVGMEASPPPPEPEPAMVKSMYVGPPPGMAAPPPAGAAPRPSQAPEVLSGSLAVEVRVDAPAESRRPWAAIAIVIVVIAAVIAWLLLG
jgi:hypothetical protein